MRQRIDEQSAHDVGAADEHHATGRDPTRAAFAPGLGDRLRDWVEWFGVIRLVTSALAIVVVGAGAWFLVRTPPPPSEASLPMAEAVAGASTSSTLVAGQAAAEARDTGSTVVSGPIVVHVAGAVAVPGVYELEPASRVDDAVRAAGGITSAADPDQLNLAAPVVDGDRIHVPEVGEVVPPSAAPVDATASTGPIVPVDVNRAGVGELDGLPGVGPATAAAIVNDRDLNGPFVAVEDLERVPGIGPAKLAALVGLVTT